MNGDTELEKAYLQGCSFSEDASSDLKVHNNNLRAALMVWPGSIRELGLDRSCTGE
jgi:hypothetical protein